MKLHCTRNEFEENLKDDIKTCDSSDLIGGNTLFFIAGTDGSVYHFCETNSTYPAGHVIKTVPQLSACDWGDSDENPIEEMMDEDITQFIDSSYEDEDMEFILE